MCACSNWLGGTASTQFMFHKVPVPVPVIKVANATNLTIDYLTAAEFPLVVERSPCLSTGKDYGSTFNTVWSQVSSHPYLNSSFSLQNSARFVFVVTLVLPANTTTTTTMYLH